MKANAFRIPSFLFIVATAGLANAQPTSSPQDSVVPSASAIGTDSASGSGNSSSNNKHTVQLGFGHARLSDNFPNWNDGFARGNVNLGNASGVVNWEASRQSHFGETGTAVALSLTRELNLDWYGSVGVSGGSGASFLPKHRVDIAVYRKWLESRQWVTGLQFTASRSGDGLYKDQAWQLSSSYYFNFPLVGEVGFKRNISNPGNVSTDRFYVAATYGKHKESFASVRYDTGREGYLPQIAGVSATNFKSRVTTLTWRQWLSTAWGYELQAEHYKNPFYVREAGVVSVFSDF
jgi:YaiO family outer membrane protein